MISEACYWGQETVQVQLSVYYDYFLLTCIAIKILPTICVGRCDISAYRHHFYPCGWKKIHNNFGRAVKKWNEKYLCSD